MDAKTKEILQGISTATLTTVLLVIWFVVTYIISGVMAGWLNHYTLLGFPLGYYMVRREIEEIPGFDPVLAKAVLHIILSHHGSLEHGSPVVPCTREAVLVHMIDNLGGRLGSFDRLERQLPDGESWSGFDRALSGSAWFSSRAA